ncbi:hypothetical protein SCP_0702980 [Sparassis crispa]|uniref:Uncharacterized protein n=1 Tax=Sparassis crispa TaxID=139825 RepID=A0A401GS98_9APHY|nr:hypothetical protein SCP_0702980 [Sparassis crispa]GBE85112.1 hypothetical protein SCP_0702980 [Sparassis crispa]
MLATHASACIAPSNTVPTDSPRGGCLSRSPNFSTSWPCRQCPAVTDVVGMWMASGKVACRTYHFANAVFKLLGLAPGPSEESPRPLRLPSPHIFHAIISQATLPCRSRALNATFNFVAFGY